MVEPQVIFYFAARASALLANKLKHLAISNKNTPTIISLGCRMKGSAEENSLRRGGGGVKYPQQCANRYKRRMIGRHVAHSVKNGANVLTGTKRARIIVCRHVSCKTDGFCQNDRDGNFRMGLLNNFSEQPPDSVMTRHPIAAISTTTI